MKIVNSVMDCSIRTLIFMIFANTFFMCGCSGRYAQSQFEYNPKSRAAEDSGVNLKARPKRCPDGMTLRYHQFNRGISFICECQSDKLFFRETQSCYDAYTRGPCREKEYLIIPEGEEIPICVKNPCEDFTVQLNGGCNQLRDDIFNSLPSPSASNSVVKNNRRPPESQRPSGGGGMISVPRSLCPKGFRKDRSGICRKELE